jgi:hypothetical protein
MFPLAERGAPFSGRLLSRRNGLFRTLILVPAAVVAGVAPACGSYEERPAAQAPNCIILANGNKLCGADAKAYCEQFLGDAADVKTIEACVSVGADLLTDAEEAELAREEGAADRKQQEAKRDDRYVAALKERLGTKRYDTFIANDAWVNAVTDKYVEIELTDAAGVRPRMALLRMICAALRDVEADALADIANDQNETVAFCSDKGATYKQR